MVVREHRLRHYFMIIFSITTILIRRIIINIGGISNISFLTNRKNNLFGFDSGPWKHFNRYPGLTKSTVKIMMLMVRLSSEHIVAQKIY